jgi:mono/diheme cytochrome c family protein
MRKALRWWLMGALVGGCASAGTRASQRAAPAHHAEPTPGFGGRLFDNWYKELHADFVPDDPATPHADGKGGPFGNGTLPDASGAPILNTGHDYRLKKLLGSDLRGNDGIDGTDYAHRAYVLVPDLLANDEPREVWIARFERGEDAIPAYGSVLSRAQIEAVVDFMLAVRDRKLPQASDLLTLSAETPGWYVLKEGGDATHGHALYAEKCASCHGADGTAIAIDHGEYSLGTLARRQGSGLWLKVLNGQPGSPMQAQLSHASSRAELLGSLRDLAAALCDRARYPRGATGTEDVSDGDPRCAAYLR